VGGCEDRTRNLNCRKRVKKCRSKRQRMAKYAQGAPDNAAERRGAEAEFTLHDQYGLAMVETATPSDAEKAEIGGSKNSPNQAATIPPKNRPHNRKRRAESLMNRHSIHKVRYAAADRSK
jgi:hypothetical protein